MAGCSWLETMCSWILCQDAMAKVCGQEQQADNRNLADAVEWGSMQAVRRMRALLKLPVGPPPQQLFPQCKPCSVKQVLRKLPVMRSSNSCLCTLAVVRQSTVCLQPPGRRHASRLPLLRGGAAPSAETWLTHGGATFRCRPARPGRACAPWCGTTMASCDQGRTMQQVQLLYCKAAHTLRLAESTTKSLQNLRCQMAVAWRSHSAAGKLRGTKSSGQSVCTAGVAMGLRYLHSSSGGSGSSGSRKQKRQKNSTHIGPDWWRQWEAPTLPRPIRGSDWGDGRGTSW
jgi:hypothetical protein